MEFKQLVEAAEKWCSSNPFDLIFAEEDDERRLDFYAEPGISFYVLCPDNLTGGTDNFVSVMQALCVWGRACACACLCVSVCGRVCTRVLAGLGGGVPGSSWEWCRTRVRQCALGRRGGDVIAVWSALLYFLKTSPYINSSSSLGGCSHRPRVILPVICCHHSDSLFIPVMM